MKKIVYLLSFYLVVATVSVSAMDRQTTIDACHTWIQDAAVQKHYNGGNLSIAMKTEGMLLMTEADEAGLSVMRHRIAKTLKDTKKAAPNTPAKRRLPF
jgi:hypothetical protein